MDWRGPISLLHQYFNRMVRLYALGLIAWGAFFPGILITIWLGPRSAGLARAVAAVSSLDVLVSFVGMFAIAVAMAWQSERAMGALGLPILSRGRLRSAPRQMSGTFWAGLSVGVLVDFLVTLALKSG